MGTSVAVQTGPSTSQMRKLRPTGTEAGTHALPHRAAARKSLETHTSCRSVPCPTPHPL